MLRPRVIPILLLKGDSLVKTVRFSKPSYIGDPINAVRIFNDLEVDELIFLDIEASREAREPNFQLIEQLAEECFMPFAYGGGLNSIDQIKRILACGVEKVIFNTATAEHAKLISATAQEFGSQAVVASVDVNVSWLGGYQAYTRSGSQRVSRDVVAWCKQMVELGAGEICLNAIHRDGTWTGFDIPLIQMVADSISVPVIASGGAGSVEHLRGALKEGRASAVGAGSLFVYQKQGLGVLINYPRPEVIEQIIAP